MIRLWTSWRIYWRRPCYDPNSGSPRAWLAKPFSSQARRHRPFVSTLHYRLWFAIPYHGLEEDLVYVCMAWTPPRTAQITYHSTSYCVEHHYKRLHDIYIPVAYITSYLSCGPLLDVCNYIFCGIWTAHCNAHGIHRRNDTCTDSEGQSHTTT